MKSALRTLFGGQLARWALLGAVLIGAGASLGWMNKRQYQLGGSWIGGNGTGHLWNALQIPLDSAGRTMALRVNNLATDPTYAGLLSALGADTVSDALGQGYMVSRDSAQWSMIGYAQLQGNPLQARGILQYTGTLTFTGPDAWVIHYTLEVFLPLADADSDGFPDAGADPVITVSDLTATAKRIATP